MISRAEIVAIVAGAVRTAPPAASPELIGQMAAEAIIMAEAIETFRRLLPSERTKVFGS